jgi:hypothetical protein
MGAGKAARAAVLGLALVAAWCAIDGVVADAQSEESEEEKPEKPPEKPGTMKIIAAYVLAIGGTLACVGGAGLTMGHPSYAQARLTMVNLLRSNPHQAERVAQTTKHTFYDGIKAAMKTAAMLGTNDPAVVPQATLPAYDGAAVQVKMHWDGLARPAKMGVMAALGGVALALMSDLNAILFVILGVLAVAGFARLLLYKMEIESTLTKARVEVLPELDRAIIDGRYVLPPK